MPSRTSPRWTWRRVQNLLDERSDEDRAGAARPEPPVRLEAPVQGDLPGRDARRTATASTSSTRPRRPRRTARPATTRGAPSPGIRFISRRHGLRGRRDRPVGRRQRRRPAVPVADRAARGSRGGRRARRPLLPPRDPEPDGGRPGRAGRTVHRRRTRTGTTSIRAATSTRATRRRSTSAADLTALLHDHPNVIAWVAGHSHQNTVDPYPNPSGTGGFWSIRVAAEADWPQQSRLLEIFDNEDGTLSIFGTILDHASPATAAAGGTDAIDARLARARLDRPDDRLQRPAVRRRVVQPDLRGRRGRPQRRAARRRPSRRRRRTQLRQPIEGTGDADELEGTPGERPHQGEGWTRLGLGARGR